MTKLQLAKNCIIDSKKLFLGHVGIAGTTGAGKSRNVAAKLLAECLAKQPSAPNGVRYAYVVVDTNDEYVGFTDRYPGQVVVFSPDATRGIPFRITSKNITIDDLSMFLREVTKKQLSKAELAALYMAIDELRAKGDYTLEQLYTRLYELEEYSLLPAFEKIMATNIFAPEETPLKLLARPGQASILAIGGYSAEVQAIIVAHLLRELFLARKNNEIAPCVIFLEECSVFAPEGELVPSSEILKSIATQARGYNFILVSIFQRSSMTSKNVLSQVGNWFIGKTGNPTDRQAILRNAEKIETEHDKVIKNLKAAKQFLVTGFIVETPAVVEIPDQKILLSKGGRIKPTVIEATFRREDMTEYVAKIRSLEETEQKRMKDDIARLRSEREEKLKVPVIPKETRKELSHLKTELQQTQVRYQKALEGLKEKEKAADRKARERFEATIKEQQAEIERLTRQVAIAGAGAPEEKPVWEQDIVKHRLKPLSEKQRDLVIFLERSGPSAAEKVAPTLGIAPKTVTAYVSEINSKIHGLVAFDEHKGVYHSRITELFPIQQSESSKDHERTLAEVVQLRQDLRHAQEAAATKTAEAAKLEQERNQLVKQLDSGKREDEWAPVLEELDSRLAGMVKLLGKVEG